MAATKATAAKKAAVPAKASDLGVSEVQATFDAETAQGFRGVEVDPTPNEHYTLKGVLAGKPTPETDAEAAKLAAEATAPRAGA